jgi:hypothetical protein
MSASSAENKRGQPGVHLGSIWGQSGVNLESIWGNLGSTWGNYGVNLRLSWGQPGVNLGPTQGQPGVNQGSTWGQPGVNLHRPTSTSYVLGTLLPPMRALAMAPSCVRMSKPRDSLSSRPLGPDVSARPVIGCHSTQKTRVHRALDDVASAIFRSLPATHVELVGVVVRRLPHALLVIAAQVAFERKV